MTKTWSAVLAAMLGLTTATLHAEQPEFQNLPPTNIKLAPLPLDTKAPLPLDTKAPLPSTYGPACGSCTYPCSSSFTTCNPCCASTNACGLRIGQRLQGLREIADRDHPCVNKFIDWLTYRPCHLESPDCCWYVRPAPAGYEWFLHPGCIEGSCGGCCKSAPSCGSCGTCGSCAH